MSRLFAAAVPLDTRAREEFLDDACEGDPTLRKYVDSLLGAHDQAGSFGDTPAFALAEGATRLAPGSLVGPFRVDALVGAGGMGEVYRARDTKLQRDVAIKVLPDSFANDPERRFRFEEEARALAALNHPHVGAIYGVEDSGDVLALVLELVEGPTLAERLAAGPLAVDELTWIGRQFAEGLEAAHDRGIVHRDLKPANIKITPDGSVKILDFGLAKPDGSPMRPMAQGASPVSPHATRAGVIVGTAAYMSPEQARGQLVDKRTDIWAFGCVLFEMCAGRPPFAGASVADTLMAVMERDPEWAALSPSLPEPLRRLLQRCLTKDPKRRLRDIGEARIALSEALDVPSPAPSSFLSRRAAYATLGLAAVVAAASTGIAIYSRRASTPAPSRVLRFGVEPPDGTLYTIHPGWAFFALSPDGSQLAIVAAAAETLSNSVGRSRVYLRAMGAIDAKPLPGTEGAMAVFWSPDGRSLGFFVDGKLKRLDLPGGAPVTVCDLPNAAYSHASWGSSGTILIADGNSKNISGVAAAGGVPKPILARNPANREVRVHWPFFLPDGRRFLYTARLDDGEGELRLGNLDGSSRLILRASSNAQWVDPDLIVFVREGVLLAQHVDPASIEPVGDPFSIAEKVEYFFTTSRAMFSASRSGTVAFHEGGQLGQLTWVDRNGNPVGTIGSPGDYDPDSVRISPDGTVVLAARAEPGLGTFDIWRMDIVRGIEDRLTNGRGSEITPALVDAQRTLVYSGDSSGSIPHLFRRDLATGADTQLLPGGLHQLVMDVRAGGRSIVYSQRSTEGSFNVFELPLSGLASPTPLLPSWIDTAGIRLSPDGRSLAFNMFKDGRFGLYVGAAPLTSPPVLADADVRSSPRWSRDGHEVYYVGRDHQLRALPVSSASTVTARTPQSLFGVSPADALLDVSPDGRFLVLVSQVRAAARPVVVDTAAIEAAP